MASLAQHVVLLENAHHPPDRGADEDPGASRIDLLDACVLPRFPRCGDREHDIALEPASILRAHRRNRVEPLHLGRDPDRVPRGVERLDESDTAPPRDRGVPRRARVEAERRDGSETRDDGAAHGRKSL